MNNPAQDKKSSSLPSGGARSQLGGLGKHVGKTAWEQPFEMVRSAGKAFGAPPQEVESAGQRTASSGQQKPHQKPKPSPEEKRKDSLMQAFREELREIKELQDKRQREMRARWDESEEVKRRREEEAKKAEKPLFEPATKVKRGILGGAGRMFGLGKKQRQVEIGKTPTN